MRLQDLPDHIQESIKGVRDITSSMLGETMMGSNGKPLCRWCRGAITLSRRQTWCSDRCVRMYKQLVAVPEKILDRDKGRCQYCQVDVLELEWLIKIFDYRDETQQDLLALKYPMMVERKEERWRLKYKISFNIDHKIPLWSGGTSTEENMQLLCITCHLFKNAKEATERSRKQ